jgi:RND family efflux transporter MFP subunit
LSVVDPDELRKSGGPQAPPPPQVSVAQVIEKRVKDWDEFTGRLQAVETVEIRPRVSGYIDKVAFTEGSLVKRGTLLFVIDPRPYQAEYDRAAADLKRFKTALELGRIELARVQRLKDSGAVSQEELDERKSTVAQAEANVAGSAAALEAAALNWNFTKVTSPVDGRVSRAEVTRGNLVTGGTNGGTLLSSVVSMDPIYLYFDADEQSYLRYSQIAAAASDKAADLVQKRIEGGLIDFLEVLDAERTALSAELLLSQSRTDAATSLIAVYKALGAGWNSPRTK